MSFLVIIATDKFIKFMANNTTIVKLNCSNCLRLTDDQLISLVTAQQSASTQTLRYFIYTVLMKHMKIPTVKKMLKLTQNLKFCLYPRIDKIQNENPTRFFVEG